ncbi:MAG: hypothetical protein KAJ14_14875, partial [Candidatus Omnitrophica bacterium]|nr:hypothetical protein [Candidatus Omnitrophota bacterium]
SLIESRTIYSEDLSVFADEDNKQIKIYYKNMEVTKSSGLKCDFKCNNITYNIYDSNWSIEQKGKTILILHLNWEQIKLGQKWIISIKDNGICCQVWLDNERSFNFEFFRAGFLFTAEYKTFFCGCQETAFPVEFDVLEDMFLENNNSDFFGLRKQSLFPAVVLESEDEFSCFIQNNDVDNSCRIFQLNIPGIIFKKGSKTFSVNIKFLEDEKMIEDYIREEKQRYLQEIAKEKASLIESRTISSGDLRVFVDIENKKIKIYYKDEEITAGDGIYSIFYTSEKGYNFNHCKWDMNKISNNKIVLNLYYESISLLHVWELMCEEGNSLTIKVEVEVKEPINFVNQDVKIELNDIFKSWATAYERGNFDVNDYINDLGPIKLKDNKISKIVLESQDKTDGIKLFFGIFLNLEKKIIDVYKRRGKNKDFTCINSSLIFPYNDSLFKPGKYFYFDGNIVLGNEFVLEENIKSSGFAEMANKDFKFIFERGRGKIFWKGEELTTGLGVYSSIRSNGVWFDSYHAIWRVEQKEENKIILIGDWAHIPVSQIWKLELIDENIISLDIDMRIYGSIKLELEQTNIMLVSQYKKWVASNLAQGAFLDDYTKDYDILPFRFWYGKAKDIGAYGATLPKIIFKSNMGQDTRGIVENTDTLYEARLLQYQRINSHDVIKDNRQYFKGIIEICNNE